MDAANAIVDKGFKAAGYVYVNSDDCWSNVLGRDNTTHQLLPNMTKFPDGIVGLADKIHGMGLKFGIYSSAGTKTCGGYPASLGYEEVDAATFAAWGIDYLVSLEQFAIMARWLTDSRNTTIATSHNSGPTRVTPAYLISRSGRTLSMGHARSTLTSSDFATTPGQPMGLTTLPRTLLYGIASCRMLLRHKTERFFTVFANGVRTSRGHGVT